MQLVNTHRTITYRELTIPYRYCIAPARAKVRKKFPAMTAFTVFAKASDANAICSLSTKSGYFSVGILTMRFSVFSIVTI